MQMAMTMQGMMADLYPRARPKMMSVAAPVLHESATSYTSQSPGSDWIQRNTEPTRLDTAQHTVQDQTGYSTTQSQGSDWIYTEQTAEETLPDT